LPSIIRYWHAPCDCNGGKTKFETRSVPVLSETLMKERQALLALELTSLGVDVRRLGFLRWLRDNRQDPEWCGESETEGQAMSEGLSLAA
jgi:hypothetical protein